jgi:hypothetical protein
VTGTSARGPVRRLAGPLVLLLLLSTVTACTGSGHPAAPHPSSPSSQGPPTAAPAPPSAPMRVKVTHVAGRLSAPRRRALAASVGRTIRTYVDAAFLSGPHPRRGGSDLRSAFTVGAVRDARRDQALLTDRSLEATTVSVHATRRTAYLSVLAPRQVVAGVTAAVDLVFVVDRGSAPAQRVQLAGRLLLTRDPRGRWRIFGYDVRRSQTPVGRAPR